MSEYQDLDRVICQTEEAIAAIKVAIAQHNSIPNQKAQLDYIAAIKEAEKWRRLFEQAEKNGDTVQLNHAMQKLWIHEDNAEKARQRMNVNSTEVDSLKRKLSGLESKLAMAKAQKAALFANRSSNPLSSRIHDNTPQRSMSTFERMEEKIREMDKLSQDKGDLEQSHIESIFKSLDEDEDEVIKKLEEMKKLSNINAQEPQYISILDQAIEETRQTIAKVKQDYQNTLNSLEKNLKALEQAKQSLLKTDEVSPSENEVVDRELEELRRQLENL